MQHSQYNIIVTQNTGAIEYSVSDSVEEKGTIVNRKKPPVYVWSVHVWRISNNTGRIQKQYKQTVTMDISVLYILMKTLLRLK